MAISRRELFVGFFSTALAALNAAGAQRPARTESFGITETLLAGLFREKAAALAVGRRYLEMYPNEAHPHFLLAAILPKAPPKTEIALRTHFAHLRRRDFETGRVVILGGWILSVTESRLCAVFALSPRA